MGIGSAAAAPVATDEVEPCPRAREDPAHALRRAPRLYGLDIRDFYDRDLQRLFVRGAASQTSAAAAFVRASAARCAGAWRAWTGSYQYTIDQVLEGHHQALRRAGPPARPAEEETKLEFIILLTVQT
jgi:hypothetical protein